MAVNFSAIMLLERLGQLKNLVTAPGIETDLPACSIMPRKYPTECQILSICKTDTELNVQMSDIIKLGSFCL
jgi:hypothetical protein